mgnify:CR=1 FL=1
MTGLWAALAFLTAIPVSAAWLGDAQIPPRRLLWWWGVVGALIGGLAAGLVWLAALRLPWIACAAIGVVALIGLTGGLHLDGFVDMCDGLGSRAPRARALAIMKDSHVGAFGVIGAISLVLLKFGLLTGLGSSWGVAAIGVAPVVGRLTQVWILRSSRYARPEGGMGVAFFAAAEWAHVAVAALCSIVTASAWLGLTGLLALAGGFALAAAAAAAVTRWLGGHTGDTVGALSETAEVAFCLALALLIGT